MSEFLAEASRALNAPEAIVLRSANARAQASGATVDEVLQAWAGGGSVTAAPPAVPEPTPVSEPVPATPDHAPTPVAAAEPAALAPAPEAAAPVAVYAGNVPAAPEETAVTAAPLSDRLRWAVGVGGLAGAALGIIFALGASPALVNRVTIVGEPGAFRPAVEVTALPVVVATAVVSLLFGCLVAVLVRAIPSWFRPDLRLEGSTKNSIVVGAVAGLLLGVVGGALLINLAGQPSELDPAVIQVGVRSGLLLVLFGGAALGILAAGAVQVIGVPAGLASEDASQSSAVRYRLATGVAVPLTAVVVLAVVVISLGTLLLTYRIAAPVIALVVAGGILSFAGLTASRPNVKLSVGEALTVLAGILAVVVLIVVVANALGGGGPAEQAPVPEDPEALYPSTGY